MTHPPRRKTEWKDEYTLLCERCGYILEDLDQALPCPECGKPIVESLPERRVGTPWQQKPGFKSLLQTWWMAVRHPFLLLDNQKTSHPRSLSIITITLASIASSLGWWLPSYLPELTRRDVSHPSIQRTLALVILVALIPFVIFSLLTFIETQGLRFIGKQRQFRVSRVCGSITAHGSVGWLMLGLGVALTQISGYAYRYFMVEQSTMTIGIDSLSGNPIRITPPWFFTNYWLLMALTLPGFLFFETFAYLGLRRCKYANRSRPNPPSDQPSQP